MCELRKIIICVFLVLFSLITIPSYSYGKKKIVLGGKNFTEQYIIGELKNNYWRIVVL